jgi:predicted Zn-dependent protease
MKLIQRTYLTAAVAMLTVSAAQAAFIVTEKEVLRQARVEWLSMKRHLPLEPDVRVQRYVECVANNIIRQLPPEQANFEWEVVVFDEEDINAFADPNGKIGVFSGILKVADTPDSLAAVIGHEVAHATQGHVMDRARRNARQDVWTMLGSAATGFHPDYFRQGIAIGVALPFAREQETDADLVGLQYMAKAGFDPRAAVYLWKGMAAAKEASGNEQPPEFLSTHPADSVRTENMVRSLTPALVEYNAAREAGQRPNCHLAR